MTLHNLCLSAERMEKSSSCSRQGGNKEMMCVFVTFEKKQLANRSSINLGHAKHLFQLVAGDVVMIQMFNCYIACHDNSWHLLSAFVMQNFMDINAEFFQCFVWEEMTLVQKANDVSWSIGVQNWCMLWTQVMHVVGIFVTVSHWGLLSGFVAGLVCHWVGLLLGLFVVGFVCRFWVCCPVGLLLGWSVIGLVCWWGCCWVCWWGLSLGCWGSHWGLPLFAPKLFASPASTQVHLPTQTEWVEETNFFSVAVNECMSCNWKMMQVKVKHQTKLGAGWQKQKTRGAVSGHEILCIWACLNSCPQKLGQSSIHAGPLAIAEGVAWLLNNKRETHSFQSAAAMAHLAEPSGRELGFLEANNKSSTQVHKCAWWSP